MAMPTGSARWTRPGQIIFGDQLLVLFGRDAVRRFGPGMPVIFDVKCSEVLPQALQAAGARAGDVEDRAFADQGEDEGARTRPLAGEMSGHMFFGGDYYGFDDALFAAARLLEIVSAQPGGLSRLLADLPKTFATPEIRVDCPEETKFDIVTEAADTSGRAIRSTRSTACA